MEGLRLLLLASIALDRWRRLLLVSMVFFVPFMGGTDFFLVAKRAILLESVELAAQILCGKGNAKQAMLNQPFE